MNKMNYPQYLKSQTFIPEFLPKNSNVGSCSNNKRNIPFDLEASSLSAPVKRIKAPCFDTQLFSTGPAEISMNEILAYKPFLTLPQPMKNQNYAILGRKPEEKIRIRAGVKQIPISVHQERQVPKDNSFDGNMLRNRKVNTRSQCIEKLARSHHLSAASYRIKLASFVDDAVCQKLEEDCDLLEEKIQKLQAIKKLFQLTQKSKPESDALSEATTRGESDLANSEDQQSHCSPGRESFLSLKEEH